MSFASVWSKFIGQPEPTPNSATPRRSFKLIRKRGYDIAGVDAFLAQLDALPNTEDGRRQAAQLIREVRFHLATGQGYDPMQVDRELDQFLAR